MTRRYGKSWPQRWNNGWWYLFFCIILPSFYPVSITSFQCWSYWETSSSLADQIDKRHLTMFYHRSSDANLVPEEYVPLDKGREFKCLDQQNGQLTMNNWKRWKMNAMTSSFLKYTKICWLDMPISRVLRRCRKFRGDRTHDFTFANPQTTNLKKHRQGRSM